MLHPTTMPASRIFIGKKLPAHIGQRVPPSIWRQRSRFHSISRTFSFILLSLSRQPGTLIAILLVVCIALLVTVVNPLVDSAAKVTTTSSSSLGVFEHAVSDNASGNRLGKLSIKRTNPKRPTENVASGIADPVNYSWNNVRPCRLDSFKQRDDVPSDTELQCLTLDKDLLVKLVDRGNKIETITVTASAPGMGYLVTASMRFQMNFSGARRCTYANGCRWIFTHGDVQWNRLCIYPNHFYHNRDDDYDCTLQVGCGGSMRGTIDVSDPERPICHCRENYYPKGNDCVRRNVFTSLDDLPTDGGSASATDTAFPSHYWILPDQVEPSYWEYMLRQTSFNRTPDPLVPVRNDKLETAGVQVGKYPLRLPNPCAIDHFTGKPLEKSYLKRHETTVDGKPTSIVYCYSDEPQTVTLCLDDDYLRGNGGRFANAVYRIEGTINFLTTALDRRDTYSYSGSTMMPAETQTERIGSNQFCGIIGRVVTYSQLRQTLPLVRLSYLEPDLTLQTGYVTQRQWLPAIPASQLVEDKDRANMFVILWNSATPVPYDPVLGGSMFSPVLELYWRLTRPLLMSNIVGGFYVYKVAPVGINPGLYRGSFAVSEWRSNHTYCGHGSQLPCLVGHDMTSSYEMTNTLDREILHKIVSDSQDTIPANGVLLDGTLNVYTHLFTGMVYMDMLHHRMAPFSPMNALALGRMRTFLTKGYLPHANLLHNEDAGPLVHLESEITPVKRLAKGQSWTPESVTFAINTAGMELGPNTGTPSNMTHWRISDMTRQRFTITEHDFMSEEERNKRH